MVYKGMKEADEIAQFVATLEPKATTHPYEKWLEQNYRHRNPNIRYRRACKWCGVRQRDGLYHEKCLAIKERVNPTRVDR